MYKLRLAYVRILYYTDCRVSRSYIGTIMICGCFGASTIKKERSPSRIPNEIDGESLLVIAFKMLESFCSFIFHLFLAKIVQKSCGLIIGFDDFQGKP